MPLKKTLRQALIILGVAYLTGCSSLAGQGEQSSALVTEMPADKSSMTPLSIRNSAAPTAYDNFLADYSFPTEIDPAGRYLFYLHGKIIEDQGIPAVSPEFGEYKFEEILETLKSHGFTIISEKRPANADVWEYARRIDEQVSILLESGVPPASITVIGASKGGYIAMAVSNLTDNPDVNYILLGACQSSEVDAWKQEERVLTGNILVIYDSVDEYAGSCRELFKLSAGKGIGRYDELVLDVGTGHGILYQPLPEWILPTIRWAYQEW